MIKLHPDFYFDSFRYNLNGEEPGNKNYSFGHFLQCIPFFLYFLQQFFFFEQAQLSPQLNGIKTGFSNSFFSLSTISYLE